MIQTLPILTREKAETRLKINLIGTGVIELSILGGSNLMQMYGNILKDFSYNNQ